MNIYDEVTPTAWFVTKASTKSNYKDNKKNFRACNTIMRLLQNAPPFLQM